MKSKKNGRNALVIPVPNNPQSKDTISLCCKWERASESGSGDAALSRLQVLRAWGGFVQEQLRKKGRLARAAESYQAELLREGICRVLRYVAAVKQHRGRRQAQHQLQVKQEPSWETRLSPHDGAS